MRGRLKKGAKLPLFQLTNVFGPSINDSLSFKMPITRVALNKDLIKQISQMKNTAAHYHLAYLTSNQVETFHRLFLLNRHVQTHHNPLTNTDAAFSNPQDYQAYINPQVVEGRGMEEVEETCLVYPFMKFIVPRYQQITLRFWDDLKKQREDNFKGYAAQLMQHCINHLDGELLMDYSISQGRFFIDKETAHHFPKTNFLLKEYSYRLKTYHLVKEEQSPEKIEQFQNMKSDYLFRVKQQYEKQSTAFSDKLKSKRIDIL